MKLAMKRFVLSLIAIAFLWGTASAQDANPWPSRPDTSSYFEWDAVNSQPVKLFTHTNTYNAQGRLAQRIQTYISGSVGNIVTRSEYTYNSLGHMTRRMDYQNGSFLSSYAAQIEYGPLMNIRVITYRYSSPFTGRQSLRDSNYTNTAGRWAYTVRYDSSSSAGYRRTERTVFSGTSSPNNPDDYILQKWKNNTWRDSLRIRYQRVADTLIRYTDEKDGNAWAISERQLTVENQGLVTFDRSEFPDGTGGWFPIYHKEMEGIFDSQNRLIIYNMHELDPFDPTVFTPSHWEFGYRTTTSLAGNLGKSAALQLWPNPATGSAVTLLNPADGEAQVTVRDAQGRIIRQEMANPGTHSLNLSELPAGTYWVQLASPNLSQTTRLVKP